MRIALIGGTGLIGGLLVPRLLEAGHEVHALQRRPTPLERDRYRPHVAPAERWPALVREIVPEAVVSALGTTMKKAGSEAGFQVVDFDMVVAFAAAARETGAGHMVTVSSVGADRRSRNFYLRIKGQMEEALVHFGFERLDIFRPGLLRGERGSDRRLGERISILVSPLANLALRGPLDRYAAIDGEQVAAAIAASVGQGGSGCFLHENRQIRSLARA